MALHCDTFVTSQGWIFVNLLVSCCCIIFQCQINIDLQNKSNDVFTTKDVFDEKGNAIFRAIHGYKQGRPTKHKFKFKIYIFKYRNPASVSDLLNKM